MLSIGSELADTYRITRLLGRGGMAFVYEAVHVRLPTRMAVKVITGDTGADPRFLQRFRQEAEILARLRHPHVVHVSDWNMTEQGQPYLVMELLEGEDLSQRLRRTGAMPLEEALPIFLQIGDALQAAHDQDVIHRDLKPANVFLLSKGAFRNYVKVLDFGIAKALNGRSGLRTKNAELLGTPAYMSPEQVRGSADAASIRSDQFALALILYELLAGRPAFYVAGDDMLQTLSRVLLEEPPPLAPYPNLDAVLRRALSKDPAARFSSVRDFVSATGAMELSVIKPLLAHTRQLPLLTAPQERLGQDAEEGDKEAEDRPRLDPADAAFPGEGEAARRPDAPAPDPRAKRGLVRTGAAATTQRHSLFQSRPSITGQKVAPSRPPRAANSHSASVGSSPPIARQ